MQLISIKYQTLLILVIGFYFESCNLSQENERPNILYIFTDDQSFRTISAYPGSYGWVKTPNIDQLARDGMLFTNCYTGAWCMPSRATALTGLHQHGINTLEMSGPYPQSRYDPNTLRFWPSEFRRAGYYNGMIGKWHTSLDDGAGRDWDYSAVWNHTLPDIYGGYYMDQKISFNGKDPVAVGGYSTDNYTKYAIDFITDRSKNKDQPWYLWLCYDAVHSPYTPAERHENTYNNAQPVPIPKDIYPPRPDKPSHMVNYGVWKKGEEGPKYRNKDFDSFIQKYNSGVMAIDEGVGKVMEVLKATGQLDNTMIVFTSDQGFAIGQHGFAWKYAPYDDNLKAPLIIRWPGKVSPGQISEHPVGGHDLVATFFAAAGIKLPWKMHGHDISPMFKNPDEEWDYPLLLENTQQLFGEDTNRDEYPSWSEIPCWVSLREGKYKYIRYLVDNEIEELYDLDADPDELKNLALSAEHKSLLRVFREKLINELKRTDAGFAENLPAVKEI